jgi:hypothetical protein
MCHLEDGGILPPGFNFREGVHTRDEKNLPRFQAAPVMPLQRFRRVRRAGRAQFLLACDETFDAVHGERRHCKSMEWRRDRLQRPMRRDVRGDHQHGIEAERSPRRAGCVQMAAMDWIERAAEDADAFDHAFDDTSVEGLALTAVHMASSNAGTPSPVAAETA